MEKSQERASEKWKVSINWMMRTRFSVGSSTFIAATHVQVLMKTKGRLLPDPNGPSVSRRACKSQAAESSGINFYDPQG